MRTVARKFTASIFALTMLSTPLALAQQTEKEREKAVGTHTPSSAVLVTIGVGVYAIILSVQTCLFGILRETVLKR